MDSSVKNYPRKQHLSFSGCGFLGIYHVGVASAFKEYAPDIVQETVVGASAGSLAAACLVNECGFDLAVSGILRMATQSRKRALGPMHPSFNINKIMFEDLAKMLPEDAHKRSTNRLHISVTRVSDGKNVILSQFDTRDELLDSLMASCFIPFFSGILPPKIKGVAYMDGGFSCNLAVYDDNTITVSPFSGETDICPSDESFNLCTVQISNTSIAVSPANLYRMVRILFAPHPDVLAKMCQQGFDDGIKYLQRHNLISCTRCLAVESTLYYPVEKVRVVHEHRDRNCDDCTVQKRLAIVAKLPEHIKKPIQEESEKLNSGLYNWIFRHRTMKTLAVITAPTMLPTDLALCAAGKVIEMWPSVNKQVTDSIKDTVKEYIFGGWEMISGLTGIIKRATSMPPATSDPTGHVSYQLAIHEFNYNLPNGKPRLRSKSVCTDVRKGQQHRVKRKSYAGLEDEKRLVSEVNLGFKMNTSQDQTMSSSVMQSMNSTADLPSVGDAVQLANEVLQENASQSRGLNAIVNVTRNKEAVMSFYYADEETHSVKVTEIFDLSHP